MLQILTLYLSTAVVFLGVDAVFLKNVMRPVFERTIGDWLLDDFRIVPAALFYLFYIAGVLIFVSLPALAGGSLVAVAAKGALLGALAYGTFEFTSYAVLERWSAQLVVMDVAWGAFLTGLAAVAGVVIARTVHG
ncbi:DUF2177 family protein [Celeribacter marinus]|uniref:Membrane protein n=1 Tax=Celeribacter marinus TaxID=1397108 RepID=A0A0N7HIY0_9RHOB|nr:DUF2177 family protein [Celeribacter marinus]ALI56477.1 Membrane protein [Celeribacter marinus]SFK42176.1 Uncharacterized membrane protein [Celeribacter marinus]